MVNHHTLLAYNGSFGLCPSFLCHSCRELSLSLAARRATELRIVLSWWHVALVVLIIVYHTNNKQFFIMNTLDQTQHHDFPTTNRVIGSRLLNEVVLRRFCFCEVPQTQTSFVLTEIRGAANESIHESRRSKAGHQRRQKQTIARFKRRITLQGLILNFLRVGTLDLGLITP